ncbi:MAG: L-threonylcarbamoyladenylate synthase [Acidimicrobiia bacterium]
MDTRLLPPTDDGLDTAATLLRAGGLVAFPTETVYGLGADALDADAVGRVFEAKGRPADNPLIVHLADGDGLAGVVAHITPLARRLAAEFWPGPLTLVLDVHPDVSAITTGGLDTVAVRVPDHPVAVALLAAAGVPVAAPSANRSGRPSPTTAAHVMADLGGRIEAVVDGGPCTIGLESTVVDARGDLPVVLREGAVTREELGIVESGDGEVGLSPGTRHRHYQPTCRVEVAEPGTAGALARELAAGGEQVGILAASAAPAGVAELGRFDDAGALAAMLYDALRRAEDADLDVVVVEAVAERGVGRAVMDRLRRAAG